MKPATPVIARVFISCPGDLAAERGVVSRALDTLNHDPEFAGRIELVTYAYENIVPARSGMDAQDVVNSYMLRPEDAHLMICMFWRRMGTPLAHFINPATNMPYQSGSEFKYLSAYAAAQNQPTPKILLYRCQRPGPNPTTAEEREQLDRVNQFFRRFEAGGDLRGLVGSFTDNVDLAATIQRDVAALLRRDLLPLLELSTTSRGGEPMSFGLRLLPASLVPRPESLAQLRKALLGSRAQVGVVAATALHGLGGLGKTTLARMAWEDPAIRAAFPDGVLWATLEEYPDIAKIQRDWVIALHGDIFKVSGLDLEAGRAELQLLLGDRAMLLILDNLWHANDAEALAVTRPRLKTLITTRDIGQAPDATPVPLNVMTLVESRQMLHASLGETAVNDATLDAIAERVGRLPLALLVIGGLLAHGKLTWPEIAREMDTGHLAELTLPNYSIYHSLDVSVWLLPADQQLRYRELVIFPENRPLDAAAVARLWARTGGLSAFVTKRLLGEFRDQSLIQADDTLHDLQVAYLRAAVTRSHQRRLHSVISDVYLREIVANAGRISVGSIHKVKAEQVSYPWRWLAWHLHKAGRVKDLKTLVTDARYLERKIALLGTSAAARDAALLGNDAKTRAFVMALQLSAHVLDQQPQQLLSQMTGRLGVDSPLHHTEAHGARLRLLAQTLTPSGGALLRTVSNSASARICAFSPDGHAVAVAIGGGVALYDIATGAELRRLGDPQVRVQDVAFSPDGRTLAFGDDLDRGAALYDAASGMKLRRLGNSQGCVVAPAFSPDGCILAIGDELDREAALYDTTTGKKVARCMVDTSIKFLQWHPSGAWIAVCDSQGILHRMRLDDW